MNDEDRAKNMAAKFAEKNHGFEVSASAMLNKKTCSSKFFWMIWKKMQRAKFSKDSVRWVIARLVRNGVFVAWKADGSRVAIEWKNGEPIVKDCFSFVTKSVVTPPPKPLEVIPPPTSPPKVEVVKTVATALPAKQLFDEHRWQLEAHHTRNAFNVCQECGNIEHSREADSCPVCGTPYAKEHNVGSDFVIGADSCVAN
ncbi:MAG: hypothetical protein WCL61_00680 [bacterium]